MKEILDFATEGNSDQCYSLIREYHDSGKLKEIADKYEEGDLGDSGLCDEIIKYIEHLEPKTYVVIMLIKEDWDEPDVLTVIAMNEDDARTQFCSDSDLTEEDLERGEQWGEICIIINEVKL